MTSPPLRRVLEAKSAVEHAEAELTARRRAYYRAILQAHEAGESYTAIGRTLGITRQRVARMVAETRKA